MASSVERLPPIGLILENQKSSLSIENKKDKEKQISKQPIFKAQLQVGRNQSNSLSKSPNNDEINQDFKLRNADMKAMINPGSIIEINEHSDFQVDDLDRNLVPSNASKERVQKTESAAFKLDTRYSDH